MPELPEVEYTRRNLDRWMRGRSLVGVRTSDPRIVRPMSPRAWERALLGRTITRVERRGKWLRLGLDDGRRLFAHLGMTGWFEPSTPGAAPLRFERARFDVERRGKRSSVAYVDARRWGRLWLSDADAPTWTELGPDPLADVVDVRALAEALSRRSRSIKEVLLDQTVLAGVGNIMATEALWKARIDPRSRARSLGEADVRAILRALRWTIERTLRGLVSGEDDGPGGGGEPFLVYGHARRPCPRCRRTLQKIVLGGRTTTFCPGCQTRAR